MTHKPLLLGLTLALGTLLAPARTARAQSCTNVNAVPYTITSPGRYCLNADLSTSQTTGAAVEIAANDVTLDLQGRTLSNLGAGVATQAEGVHARDRRNIVVRNGRIVGFFTGVHLDILSDSRNHVIEGLRVEQSRFRGIKIEGYDNIVRNNLIRDTGGGGTHPDGMTACDNQYNGSVQALNNTIINVGVGEPDSSPDGMMLYCFTSVAIGNRLVNVGDSGIAVAGGYCKDNVMQQVWGRPYDPSNGNGCTLIGSTNFNYP